MALVLGILRGLNCSICIFGQVVKVPGPSDVLRNPDPRKSEGGAKNQGVEPLICDIPLMEEVLHQLVGNFSHYCIYKVLYTPLLVWGNGIQSDVRIFFIGVGSTKN